MKNKLIFWTGVALFALTLLALSPLALIGATQPKPVNKLTDGSDALTESLAVPAGKTLTVNGSLTGTPTGGMLNLGNVTLTLPAAAVDNYFADPSTNGSFSASAWRSDLGLVIGTNVQAWSSVLDGFALKSVPTGAVAGTSDTQTFTNKTLSDASGSDPDFTIVVLPDPQNLTDSDVTVAVLNAQVQWAVDHKVDENVKAVVTVGDMMNGPPNTTRRGRAVTALNLAKSAGIPVVPIVGNHDYDSDSVAGRATTVFDGGFGPSYFSGQSYYGASTYPSNSNANYYITFTNGATTYLVLALEVFPRPAAVAWAQGIIAANPSAYIIITTHAYLKQQGSRVLDADAYGPTAMGLPGADYNGDELYTALVAPYANVRMVLSGHFIGGLLANRDSTITSAGAVVHQLFVNYQDEVATAQYMMILRFKPASGTVAVSFYSPTLGAEDAANPAYVLAYQPIPVSHSIRAENSLYAGQDVVAKRSLTVGPGSLPNRVQADATGNLFVGTDDRTGMSGGGQLRVKNGAFLENLTASSIPYVNASKKLASATLTGLTLSNGTLSVDGTNVAASAPRDALNFDGVAGTRGQWGLSTYGDGLGAAGGKLTVLHRFMAPAAAATRNLWGISQAQDAYSYGGNALLCYLHSGDKLRVEIGDSTAANRRYVATDLAVISRYASTLVALAVTHDGSTTAPLIYLDGALEAATASGTGTQPAWNAGFNDDFLTIGTQQGGSRWTGIMEPPVILNTVLSAADILTWSRTGNLPDWAKVTVGSMVAQTSGTLTVGWRYRIASYVSGDSFTNVGAGANATGTEFTATGTTPTTWSNASQVIPVGPLYRPVVQPIRVVADGSSNLISGVLIGGVLPITSRRDWVIQARTSTNGNQALLASTATPFIAANKNRIRSWSVLNAGSSRTIDLGSTNGGAEYLSAGTAAAGPTDFTLITRFNQSTMLYCKSNGTDVLTHIIYGDKIE